MKHIISIGLACVLAFAMVPDVLAAEADRIAAIEGLSGSTANINEISDPELAHAVSLGIGIKITDETITYEQFLKVLDNAVKLADPTKLGSTSIKFTHDPL
jgi:hypothetical protein